MKHIRLATEFWAPPIFCSDVDEMGHIEIDELPISEGLKARLRDWDSAFQAIYNDDYPPDSAFPSPEAKQAHVEEGRRLAQALREELGDAYAVEHRG